MCSVARGHQVVIATVAAVTALAIAPSTAFGAPAAATIDTDELTLTAAADGGWSTAVGMTNLTTGPLGVTAMAKPATCDLKVGPVTYHTVTELLKDLQPTKKDKAAPRGGRRKRVMLAAEPVELTLAGRAALP